MNEIHFGKNFPMLERYSKLRLMPVKAFRSQMHRG